MRQLKALARRLYTSRDRLRGLCTVLQVERERQGDELASGLAVEPLPLAIVHQRLATGNPPQVERLRRGIVVRNQCDDGTGADTPGRTRLAGIEVRNLGDKTTPKIGRATCRERVCQ